MWRSAFLLLVACQRVPPKPAATHATAEAAYNAKHYDECAEQFADVAKTAPPSKRADELYSAACCHALGGHADAAFVSLEAATSAGFIDVDNAMKDDDLVSLHSDPRWPKALERIKAQIAFEENKLREPALHHELVARVQKDQDARFAYIAKQKAGETADFAEANAIDADNLIWLHEVLDKHGWPTKSMVGADGAHDAWLLTQHADHDLAFQKQVLALMKPLAETDEVSKTDYAYLYDRVAVGEHRKQLYGTQFDEHQEPQPIEDEANVDARRKAAGMGTMDEYRAQMRKMYGAPKK